MFILLPSTLFLNLTAGCPNPAMAKIFSCDFKHSMTKKGLVGKPDSIRHIDTAIRESQSSLQGLAMHLYPVSLLITAAVLLPNILFLALPPLNVSKYGKSADSLLFTILERIGQVGSFILPLFFPLSFSGALVTIAWIVMGLALAFYIAGWVRFFLQGRDYALLFMPMLGVPIPMAISPVLYFMLASVVLGSVYQAVAAVVLGVGHITITAREYIRLKGASS